jgi:hypothetical protein
MRRVQSPTGVHAVSSLGEALGGLREPAAVRLGKAEEDHLEGDDGPEGGEAGALGGERRGRSREAVVLQAGRRGAQRAGVVPRRSGTS